MPARPFEFQPRAALRTSQVYHWIQRAACANGGPLSRLDGLFELVIGSGWAIWANGQPYPMPFEGSVPGSVLEPYSAAIEYAERPFAVVWPDRGIFDERPDQPLGTEEALIRELRTAARLGDLGSVAYGHREGRP